MGRYTHRTAISNDRLLAVNQETVTFTWNAYKQNYATQITTLPGEEFLRLFCMHILPFGFTRIRHYGFLSSASKRKSLAIIRGHIGTAPTCEVHQRPWQEIAFEKMGIKPGFCKCCGGKMVVIETMPNQFRKRQRAPPVSRNKILPSNEIILNDCNLVL
ncbi:MAG: transposase [Bacteroidota bacterium]|nr:transposase [Bacteroidota bacterium]